jgi:hypothetical protein
MSTSYSVVRLQLQPVTMTMYHHTPLRQGSTIVQSIEPVELLGVVVVVGPSVTYCHRSRIQTEPAVLSNRMQTIAIHRALSSTNTYY